MSLTMRVQVLERQVDILIKEIARLHTIIDDQKEPT